jgi:hypothetical protein
MNEETLCSAAGLSRISQTRPHKPCSSPFQVRIGADYGRIGPAKF